MKITRRVKWLLVTGCACTIVGCSTPRPEMLEQSERDKMTYVDKGASAKRNDVSFRIAVCVDQKDFERHPAVGEAIEAQLAEAVSRLKIFQFVERSRIDSLSAERLFQGQNAEKSSLLKAADYLLSVKLNVSTEECTVLIDNYTGKPTQNTFGSRPETRWKLNLRPDFRLYEVDSCKVVLTKSYESSLKLRGTTVEEVCANVEATVTAAMKVQTLKFSTLLTSRYAPKARVLQTRGDGRVAQMSIGADYGVLPGMEVEFYRYQDNSDIVAGSERSMDIVGFGRVREDVEVGPNTAWVDVSSPSAVAVMRGHYVRVRAADSGDSQSDKENSLVDRFILTKLTKDLGSALLLPGQDQDDADVWSGQRQGTGVTPSARESRRTARRATMVQQPVAAQPVAVQQPVAAQPAIAQQQRQGVRLPTKDSKGVNLFVQGKGSTKELAVRDALRMGLLRALRIYVGVESLKRNEAAVLERIKRLPNIGLRNEIIEVRQELNGVFLVKVKVSVAKTQIVQMFADIFPVELSR